jgi:hypothetical protein
MKLVQILQEWVTGWKWRKPGTWPDQLRAFAAIALPKRIE